jgi:ribonucleotide monophosphatase NagD (HAD superfamily)
MLDQIDTFLLDCDGVIWNGDSLIEGAAQTIEYLKRLGKRVLFVSNNSSKSRRMYLDKFQKLGIECTVVIWVM